MPDRTPTILIIDNDDAMVAAISTRLSQLGHRCITAGSGAQGISLFAEEKIDLVITDLNMPAGDGVALATSIRETSDVPIIIVTGFHDAFRRQLRSVTNISLLQKPFTTEQLIDVVEADLLMTGCTLPVAVSARSGDEEF